MQTDPRVGAPASPVSAEAPGRQALPLHLEWYRSLRARIALPFIVLSAIVFLILYLVLSQGLERVFIDRRAEEMTSQARIAAVAVEQAGLAGRSPAEVASMLDEFSERAGNRYTLISATGTVLVDTRADVETMENHNNRPEVVAARQSGSGVDRRTSGTVGEPFMYVAVMVPQGEGTVLRLAVPASDIEHTVSRIGQFLLIALVSILALALPASWLIAGRLSGMLDDLRLHANAVAAGDFSTRMHETGITEMTIVGDAFNSMASRLEQLIRQQELMSIRLEAVMAGLADGVVLTDGEGQVLRMNDAAQEMLDTDEESARGRPFVQVSRDHEMARVLDQAFEGKKNPSATVEYGIERASLLVTARAIADREDLMGLIVIRDVTELRRLETVRREFVANVSHELRTPLASIRALVETLEAGAIDEEEIAMDFLGRIVGEVDRLNRLVEDLLDFARLEAGRAQLNRERVDLGTVVGVGADRLRPQVDRAGLSLQVEVDADLPEIEVDVARIEQVIVNLVHNAIKFTPSGGSITVRVYQRRNSLAIDVQDTGVGIAPEELTRLFERFYKSDKARRSEGTGLGLAIVKNIVLSHGGQISVESIPGEGATFRITLPLKTKKARKRAWKHALGRL